MFGGVKDQVYAEWRLRKAVGVHSFAVLEITQVGFRDGVSPSIMERHVFSKQKSEARPHEAWRDRAHWSLGRLSEL